MKLLLIINLIPILLFCSCSQQGSDRNEKPEEFELVYFNHFEKADTVFWTGNDGFQYAEVHRDNYYFEALDSNIRFNAPNFDIDIQDNFQLELAITGPDNEDSSFYGLIIGNLDMEDESVELKLNNSGQYTISSHELLDEGTYSSEFNKKLKKIKVLKRGLDTHFFIDDREVFKYPIQKFSKFRAGPITAKNSAIWMDYFKLEKVKAL